jgi:HSP20 family protein
MESLANRFFAPMEEWWSGHVGFVPRTNLVETEDRFEVTVDLPGVKPEDVHVEFNDGTLWIRGEQKEEQEEKGKTFHRVERHYGEFRRMVPLPKTIDEAAVNAKFKDGVLMVTVPKTEEAKPRHIEVKSN